MPMKSFTLAAVVLAATATLATAAGPTIHGAEADAFRARLDRIHDLMIRAAESNDLALMDELETLQRRALAEHRAAMMTRNAQAPRNESALPAAAPRSDVHGLEITAVPARRAAQPVAAPVFEGPGFADSGPEVRRVQEHVDLATINATGFACSLLGNDPENLPRRRVVNFTMPAPGLGLVDPTTDVPAARPTSDASLRAAATPGTLRRPTPPARPAPGPGFSGAALPTAPAPATKTSSQNVDQALEALAKRLAAG